VTQEIIETFLIEGHAEEQLIQIPQLQEERNKEI